ncbi:hypothetical protein [Aeromicrobium sp. NPDC092404]|uniref:hypothetical protein n=1 Tax=Aeromicrobium sp. NPDC092404 TaxID=3154976 RepID=UPI003415DE07
MRLIKRLMLVAAALAVAGFVLVAVGESRESTPSGWYANSPSETETSGDEVDGSYSSTLTVTYDDDSGGSTVTLLGFGLVGLSFLLTIGLMGYWAVRRPGPTT